jgi:Flp pilus assembly protein TadG
MVVILVPVAFGLIGFAVDLGMLYSAKNDLQMAANAMAIAAAQRLIGTDTATDAASAAALQVIETGTGFGNKYNFNGLPVGQTTGNLVSNAPTPSYFSTVVDAISADSSATAGGATARHASVTLSGETPLLFWSFLPIVTDRKIAVMAKAVAGVSSPLCTACGIEPYAVGAIDATDTNDFGFVVNVKYSFTYLCGGNPTPPILFPGVQRVNYLLLNRLDPNALIFTDESSQAYRYLAAGMPGNTVSSQACFRVNNTELVWVNAPPPLCSALRTPPLVTASLCGLDTRFESATQVACAGIPEVDTLSSIFQPDTDINDYDVYTDYTGTGRRLMTIPIVDLLSGTNTMTVLGFRQFLISPATGAVNIVPSDTFGRFVAMYVGTVAPVKQGSFAGCQISAGPGKVVLHQ